jgi:hypothetical protein
VIGFPTVNDWQSQFLAATQVERPTCAVPGCLRPASVAWRERNDCVAHFLEVAQQYLNSFQVSDENATATYPDRQADPQLLTECILRGAALLTSGADFDRYEESHLLRLLSDCRALLRLARTQTPDPVTLPARTRAARAS